MGLLHRDSEEMKTVTVVLRGGYAVGAADDPAQHTLVFSEFRMCCHPERSFDGTLSVCPT